MIVPEKRYLEHIQNLFPELILDDIVINRDGMVNVSVIVNRARVFRFPREEWGIPLLRQEMAVLDLIEKYVDIPTPIWDYRSDEMVSYRFIPGDPLLTDDVGRMSKRQQHAVAEKLGTFLQQLHSIPVAEVNAAGIGRSNTERTVDDWLRFYADIETHLFPLMWADGREWVRRHFAPFLADHTLWHHEPVFMHGDLATYHILFDRQTKRFNGIIDFGTAGIGDPAADFATMINQYGESFLRKMAPAYPAIKEQILRSRFWAGTLELQWLLQGIQRQQNDMLVVHIGRARDMLPIDAGWLD